MCLARFPAVRARWDRSLPPPVAETGRRSVGNRKERPRDATVRVPRRKRARWETPGRELLPGHLRVSATLYLARFFPMRALWAIQHGEKRPGESCSRAVFSQVQHCTWLGFQPCAPSGTGACRRQWRKQAGGASGIARSGQRGATVRVPRIDTAWGKAPGRVGRCRIPDESPRRMSGVFLWNSAAL